MSLTARLRALAGRSEGPALLGPDGPREWADLLAAADALGPGYAPLAGRRAALTARDPADVVAHAAAAAAAGVELHLLRPSFGEDLRARLRERHGLFEPGGEPGGEQAGSAAARADVAVYTSGTTDVPKPTLHRWDRLLPADDAAGRLPGATWLLCYDAATFAGLQVLGQVLVAGGTLVVPASVTLADLLAAVERHGDRVTAVSATPTLWRGVLAHGGRDLAGRMPLVQVTLGGERADQGTLDRLREIFPAARIVHLYASSEAGAVFSVADGREGFPAAWLGAPLPSGARLHVAGDRLLVESPRAMLGYAGDPPPPGLWPTGDLVEVRGDRVRFLGREGETINVGGRKVHPGEVEAVLLAVPGVEAAVVSGRPSSLVGELVTARIVVAPGFDGEDVIRRAREAASGSLAPHMVPRILEVAERPAPGDSGKTPRGPAAGEGD